MHGALRFAWSKWPSGWARPRAAKAGAAMAADGVDFVDKDDAGRVLLGLFEHVAHAGGADADEHLDEVRARNGEERHVGLADDLIASLKVEQITAEGMKIDRMFFQRFEDSVRDDVTIAAAVEAGQWDRVIDYVNREVFDKPTEYYSLDKLRKAAAVDRRLCLREILEKIFGLIPRFKSKDELLEEEFAKFVADTKPDEAEAIPAIKNFFKAYASSHTVRGIIDSGHLTDLATNPFFSTRDHKAVPAKYRALIPNYIKDYVS